MVVEDYAVRSPTMCPEEDWPGREQCWRTQWDDIDWRASKLGPCRACDVHTALVGRRNESRLDSFHWLIMPEGRYEERPYMSGVILWCEVLRTPSTQPSTRIER